MVTLKKYFSTREAARLAGYKRASMIDYLCRTGVVEPSGRHEPGRGRGRLYTFGDVVLLRAISGLLASGLPVRRLRIALDELRRGQFQNLRENTAIAQFLITDGTAVWLKENPSALTELTSGGQMAFAFVVDIHAARDTVLQLVASRSGK